MVWWTIATERTSKLLREGVTRLNDLLRALECRCGRSTSTSRSRAPSAAKELRLDILEDDGTCRKGHDSHAHVQCRERRAASGPSKASLLMAYCLEGTTLHLFQLSLITCRREAGRTGRAHSRLTLNRSSKVQRQPSHRCGRHLCSGRPPPPPIDGTLGLPKVDADPPPPPLPRGPAAGPRCGASVDCPFSQSW